MGRLPFGRLFLFIALSVIATAVAGYEVCVATGNVGLMSATMIATSALTLTPVCVWWYRTARAAGIPKVPWTANRVGLSCAMLVAIAGTIALEVWLYGITGNRIVEALAGIAVVAVGGPLYFSRMLALMPWQNAPSRQAMRMSFYVLVGSIVIMSLNAWLQIHQRHDYGLGTMRAYLIAGYFVLIPMNAVYAFYLRRFLSTTEGASQPTSA